MTSVMTSESVSMKSNKPLLVRLNKATSEKSALYLLSQNDINGKRELLKCGQTPKNLIGTWIQGKLTERYVVDLIADGYKKQKIDKIVHISPELTKVRVMPGYFDAYVKGEFAYVTQALAFAHFPL